MRTADESVRPGTASPDLGGHRAVQLRAIWDQHHLGIATALTLVFTLVGGLGEHWAGTGTIWRISFLAAYVCGGTFSLIEGMKALRSLRIDVDLLMVLAAVAAAAIGEWTEGAILLFLFSLSNALQHYALARTRKAIRSLMALRPDTASRLRSDGTEEVVPLESLAVGDTLVIRPGERVPMDGRIAAGHSYLDESSITGESIPAEKGTGDEVFAGTINQHGALRVNVTRLAGETMLARIIRLVEEAQSEEAPTQRLIDRVEQVYATAVIGLTLVAAFLPMTWGVPAVDAIYRAVTLMVVASPCAVAMSAPAPIVAAIAAAARRGVLFKGGVHLEHFSEIRVMAFDKTGTLTHGTPALSEVVAYGDIDDKDLLALAAAVEGQSEHVLARSVVHAASERGVERQHASDVQALPGRGVTGIVDGRMIWAGNRRLAVERVGSIPEKLAAEAEKLEHDGRTVTYIGDERCLGILAFQDRLRDDARAVIEQLRYRNIDWTVMLTGDNERVANAVARQVGIDEVRAGLLPDEKVQLVEAIRKKHGRVAMVGDGVNDAPALARATVGVAMGAAGTDVALETADVVLMSDDLTKLDFAVDLSRRTRRIIWQNLTFALGVIAVLIVMVLTQGVQLAFGVLGHEGSTVLVVLNSLRLLAFGRHARAAGEESSLVEQEGMVE